MTALCGLSQIQMIQVGPEPGRDCTSGPCCNDPARPTQRSHLRDRRGLPVTDGGLLRRGSWAGLLEANRATIRAARLPASQHVPVLAPPLPQCVEEQRAPELLVGFREVTNYPAWRQSRVCSDALHRGDRYIKVNGVKTGTSPLSIRTSDSQVNTQQDQEKRRFFRPTEGAFELERKDRVSSQPQLDTSCVPIEGLTSVIPLNHQPLVSNSLPLLSPRLHPSPAFTLPPPPPPPSLHTPSLCWYTQYPACVLVLLSPCPRDVLGGKRLLRVDVILSAMQRRPPWLTCVHVWLARIHANAQQLSVEAAEGFLLESSGAVFMEAVARQRIPNSIRK
ncbi:unnamed protein product [Pleuronectes platessa]|uniref:Uncharacterized protein n=1 Tax=Pleuronectes platessa TaxID=8262 RepID=A0A9N7YW01_PLEPL|nr:unnamed protein product [Pleuronectes platessa]